MKELETERLILRKFKIEDAEKAYENWAGVSEIAEKTDFKKHANVEETRAIIESGLGEEGEDLYTYAIVLKEILEPIGFIRVYEIMEKHKKCKILWTLGFKWWNNGITVEAVNAIMNYLFNDRGFNIVVCEYQQDMDRLNSKIALEVGMIKEAELRDRYIDDNGNIKSRIIYSITKEEYTKKISEK